HSFHEHIETYLEYERLCNHDEICKKNKQECILDKLQFTEKYDEVTCICERFYCLLDKLFTPSINNNENAHLEYLKYWLNYELREIDDTYPKAFHQNLKTNYNTNDTLKKLDGKWDKIDKDEEKNMNLLFYFYTNCIHIIKSTNKVDANKSFAMKNANHCVQKYQELEKICPNNTKPF
ncbi:hypothetical protein PCYB_008260, partial [Plasmodium cynomolgi strain B]